MPKKILRFKGAGSKRINQPRSTCTPKDRNLCGVKSCKTCFARSFAAHPRSKEWADCNEKKPWQLFKASKEKCYLKCKKCTHIYFTEVNHITCHDSGCPYCAHKLLCKNDNCMMCFINSFAFHPRSLEWAGCNDEIPRNVYINSLKKRFFCCAECKHLYQASPKAINHGKGSCRYCCNQILCDDDDCIICFKKSFAANPLSEDWNDGNDKTARQVFGKSIMKYVMNCIKCDHVYEISPATVNRFNSNCCPYCDYRQLCDRDDCDDCYNKSFASNIMSKYWSEKNDVSAREAFLKSDKFYLFDCPFCHNLYRARLKSVAKGKWCSCKRNKSEEKLFKFLRKNIKYVTVKQKKFEWCRNKCYLPFDFYIKGRQILIELDGPHHFIQIANWCDPKQRQRVDKHKMKLANNRGYSIIRIYQPDVWDDKNDWQNKLLEAIEAAEPGVNQYIGDVYAGTFY